MKQKDYVLYERVAKTPEYPKGSKIVEDGRNAFLEGPCLLCVAASQDEQSVFGMSKIGMTFAGLRTNDRVNFCGKVSDSRYQIESGNNGMFDIKDFPVTFLSLEKHVDDISNMVEDLFIPLVSANGNRIDIKQAMKNMRNVNILSYCDGALVTKQIEQKLVESMKKMGYEGEEISKIQSQMFMLPIVTNRLSGEQQSTCFSSRDINDIEISQNVNEHEREEVAQTNIKGKLFKHSNNEYAYYGLGNGEHDLKTFIRDEGIFTVVIASVLSKALENAVENSNSNDFKMLEINELVSDIPNLEEMYLRGMTRQEVLNYIYSKLEYGGATRLTDRECEALNNYELQVQENDKLKRELENSKDNNQKLNKAIIDSQKVVKENCTDDTYLKYLLSLGGNWAPTLPEDEEKRIKTAKGDKQKIEELEQRIVELQKKNGEIFIEITPKDIASVDKEIGLSTTDIENCKSQIDKLLDKDKQLGRDY